MTGTVSTESLQACRTLRTAVTMLNWRLELYCSLSMFCMSECWFSQKSRMNSSSCSGNMVFSRSCGTIESLMLSRKPAKRSRYVSMRWKKNSEAWLSPCSVE